jgi:soluble lytic murein transglycosylase-like protein
MPLRSKLVPKALLTLALAALAAPGARAELVLLQGGEVLKVKAYEIGAEQARLTLPSGGVLTLSVMRIDRVLADEIVPAQAQEPPPAAPTGLVLGFREEDAAQPEVPYGAEILAAARQFGVNPALVAAVTRVESAFRASARSHKGARGLMQLMPATAARFGVAVEELYKPTRNIEAGTRYLRWLLDHFGEDPQRVIAAYNAGENAVERYGGIPPYRETEQYVKRVMAMLDERSAGGPVLATSGR